MRLIALVDSPTHVCCRYRLAAYKPFLLRAGHQLDLLARPVHEWGWLRLALRLRQADVVILQRKLLRVPQRSWLRRLARAFIFDFDDAVFLRDSYAPKGFHSRQRQARFAATVRAADRVVAGNAYLQENAATWTPRERVHLIPTCLDPAGYTPSRRQGPGNRLIWVGSSSTLRGLERARSLFEQVGRDCRGLHLHLVCDRFTSFAGWQTVPIPWSEDAECEALPAADIGMAWMPNDPWSRGKCGLKVLQYMAAGLPVVANPVGIHVELVRPGLTGFLAETPEQWVDAIGRLRRDPALRRRMGAAGRQLVATEYSVAAGAKRWLALIDDLNANRGKESA